MVGSLTICDRCCRRRPCHRFALHFPAAKKRLGIDRYPRALQSVRRGEYLPGQDGLAESILQACCCTAMINSGVFDLRTCGGYGIYKIFWSFMFGICNALRSLEASRLAQAGI